METIFPPMEERGLAWNAFWGILKKTTNFTYIIYIGKVPKVFFTLKPDWIEQ